VLLRIWNSVVQKDRNVTGGNTQQTYQGKFVEPGKQNLVDATLAASPPEEKNSVQAKS
jgi:hypothetical protein